MPQDIVLDELPAGILANSARKGEQVQVQMRGMASSEDGLKLVNWLEWMVSPALQKLRPPINPSVVDNFVAIIHRDRRARVYVNEVALIGKVRVKGAVTRGQPVFVDQVADFGPMTLKGVDAVPDEAGLVVFISHGWRQGLFFDFGPLHGQARDFPIANVLGSLCGYLAFQERLGISDAEWSGLLGQGWFPFVGLRTAQIRGIVGHITSGWNADELLPEITRELQARCPAIMDHAAKVPAFAGHLEVLRTALGHFTTGDWLSAAALLYPRIEGILRGHAEKVSSAPDYSQKGLVAAAGSDLSGTRLAVSLLLPEKFQQFLRETYFAPFDPSLVAGVSRHTVSHGVAPEAELDEKAATIAILVVEQLLYLCGADPVLNASPNNDGSPNP